MTVYATVADLDAWLGFGAPPHAPRLLDRASTVVAYAVRTKIDTDANGIPTDAGKRDVLRDATCAQVEAWLADSEQADIVACGDDEKCAPPPIARRAARILHMNGLRNAAVA